MQPPRILIFEPYTGGHHGLFMQHLVAYWCAQDLQGRLDLVVAEGFWEKHKTLSALLESCNSGNIQVHTFKPELTGQEKKRLGLVAHDLQMGGVLRSFIEKLKPSHCLLMYFDHLQVSLASNLRFNFPIQFGGIYFRPSFHYPELMQKPAGWKEGIRNLRKKTLLRLALRNPHFNTLFCLDPYVIPDVERLNRRVDAVALPDGVEISVETSDGRIIQAAWSIQEDRSVALLFGSLAARKGIFQILEALPMLDPARQQHLAVVFSGSVVEAERGRLERSISRAKQQSGVQIVLDDRFVEDSEVPALFRYADLILAVYQKHIGSSNVLIRAAKAGRPVLGSDYGLMGEQIRRHKLGLAIDAANPAEIAQGLAAFLAEKKFVEFDPPKAIKFSEDNTAARFAETVFSQLCTHYSEI